MCGCLFLVTFVLVCAGAHAQLNEGECFTPNRSVGNCINIKKCRPIVQLLRVQPRTPETVRILRQSQCGYEGFDPKVCCPGSLLNRGDANEYYADEEEPESKVDTSYSYYREYPPCVEEHPNLKLLPSSCGSLEEERAFGGNKTGVFEFPWMALISYRSAKGMRFLCGGTIINSRYILTAAHCITNLKGFSIAGVRVGEHDISTEEDCEDAIPRPVCAPRYQDMNVEEVIPHPKYIGVKGSVSKFQNDIGLLRLNPPIDMKQDNIMPICLPVTQELQNIRTDGLNMTVTGWGATETSMSSSMLLKITIPIVDNVLCGKVLNHTIADGIGFRQMCAGGVFGIDSCNGDSGGPLQFVGTLNHVLRFVEHGIVSFGSQKCGSQDVPGIYTRVAYYMDWILDNIRP